MGGKGQKGGARGIPDSWIKEWGRGGAPPRTESFLAPNVNSDNTEKSQSRGRPPGVEILDLPLWGEKRQQRET